MHLYRSIGDSAERSRRNRWRGPGRIVRARACIGHPLISDEGLFADLEKRGMDSGAADLVLDVDAPSDDHRHAKHHKH